MAIQKMGGNPWTGQTEWQIRAPSLFEADPGRGRRSKAPRIEAALRGPAGGKILGPRVPWQISDYQPVLTTPEADPVTDLYCRPRLLGSFRNAEKINKINNGQPRSTQCLLAARADQRTGTRRTPWAPEPRILHGNSWAISQGSTGKVTLSNMTPASQQTEARENL